MCMFHSGSGSKENLGLTFPQDFARYKVVSNNGDFFSADCASKGEGGPPKRRRMQTNLTLEIPKQPTPSGPVDNPSPGGRSQEGYSPSQMILRNSKVSAGLRKPK